MLNDKSLILKIGNYNFGEGSDSVAKEVHYQHECKNNYLHEEDKSSNTKDSALARLLSYIRNKIIAENKPALASFLLDPYKNYYAAKGGNEIDLAAYSIKNICCMLRLSIPLNIEAKSNKTVIWKKGNMKYDEALPFAKINAESDDCMIWRCANKLRNDIFAVQNKYVSQSLLIT